LASCSYKNKKKDLPVDIYFPLQHPFLNSSFKEEQEGGTP